MKSDGDTIFPDAARELADYLSAHPKLFGRVIDTAGSHFFRRNGLLYLDLDSESLTPIPQAHLGLRYKAKLILD